MSNDSFSAYFITLFLYVYSRYVGLDALKRLTRIEQMCKEIRKYSKLIYHNLNDYDPSVSSSALDVLYCICDDDNVVEIIDYLLDHLNKKMDTNNHKHNYTDKVTEYGMENQLNMFSNNINTMSNNCNYSNIVLRICILVEKYYTRNLKWYVDVILKLLTIAGDYVDDTVWHHLIQIVCENDDKDLAKDAVKKIFATLHSSPSWKINESIIKLAGFILGEFSHLLLENVSGKQQFDILSKNFYQVSDETKLYLLSTFMKFVNLYPDQLSHDAVKIFKSCNSCVNLELQQRAVEYEIMVTSRSDQIVKKIVEDGVMPDFSPLPREHNLLNLVKNKHQDNKEKHEKNEDDIQCKLAVDENLYKKSLLKMNSVLYNDYKILRFGMKSDTTHGSGLMTIIFYFGNYSKFRITNVFVQFENDSTVNDIEMLFATQNFNIESRQEFALACKVYMLFNHSSNASGVPVLKITFCMDEKNYLLRLKIPIIATKFFRQNNFDNDDNNNTQFKHHWIQHNQQSQTNISLNSTFQNHNVDLIRNVLTQFINIGLVNHSHETNNDTYHNFVGSAICDFATKRKDGKNVSVGVLIRYVNQKAV